MLQIKIRMPLKMVPKMPRALVIAALVATSINFNPAVDATEEKSPLVKTANGVDFDFNSADPVKASGISQIPFDKARWQADAASRSRMMGDVIKTKALLGCTKQQMDQDFGAKAIAEHDGYTSYDLARNSRYGGGYGLEAVYKDDVVQSYRIVEFANHTGLVDKDSDWVK